MKTLLFKNAQIYPDPFADPFNWMIVCCGKILTLGDSKHDIPSLTFDHIYDLGQKVVLPSFGDAHVHSLWMARRFFEVDLSDAPSLNEALRRLKAATASHLSNQDWVIGRGFNKNVWTDASPHLKYLDRLFPNHPVFLQSQDCHSAWVNSEALRRCGINEQTAAPSGGRIEKDKQNKLTGMLFDRAVDLVARHLPEPSPNQLENGLLKFIRKLHAWGITFVHTMENLQAFAFWQTFLKKFPRSLRVTLYVQHEEMEPLIQAKLQSGFGNDWLQLGGVKLFSDGSLGSQTALLTEPYEGTTDHYGLELLSEKELQSRIQRAECHGLAVAVHAIGDRAVERVLKALKRSESCRKQYHLTSRIEHAQLIRPDLLPLFRQYGLLASMQPVHIADDVPVAERYWGKRSRWAFAFRSLISAGVPLAFGSDAPVADPDPRKGLFSAVNRRYRLDLNEPIWHSRERITLKEALTAYTLGVARAAQRQQTVGSLEPGKQADFIVLNKDPFILPEEELLSLKIEQTYLAGEQVFPQSKSKR